MEQLDIVERLRGKVRVPVNDGAGLLNGLDYFERTFPTSKAAMEAADEIEKLREQLVQLRMDHGVEYEKVADDNERLRKQLASANDELTRVKYHYGALSSAYDFQQKQLVRAREALAEISQGKGTFSRDHFEHARNTIADMKELAVRALGEIDGNR